MATSTPGGIGENTRQAVRALLVTQNRSKILLLKVRSPVNGNSIWMTPGGGIENKESDEQALQREIWEETGLHLPQTGKLVFTRHFSFQTSERKFSQFEKYFLVFVDEFVPNMNNNPAAHERSIFQEYRWWNIDKIPLCSARKTQSVEFAPSNLGTRLKDLLANGL